MVVEDRIPISKFVLHQVDRDPENGMYGGDRILTEEYGDMEIISYDVGQGIVRARDIYHQQPRVVFKLLPNGEAKSDLDLFNRKTVARWNELKTNYEGDDNITDYMPAYYNNLEDMSKNKMHVVKTIQTPTQETSIPVGVEVEGDIPPELLHALAEMFRQVE